MNAFDSNRKFIFKEANPNLTFLDNEFYLNKKNILWPMKELAEAHLPIYKNVTTLRLRW